MPSPKQLVVTVDTEEEGLWGGVYQVSGNTTENLRALPRFQSLCESLGVPPTYLIDAPVLDDAQAMARLRDWQQADVCEVGCHCHPWCTPPLPSKPPTSAETYLCNFPIEVQRQKLGWMTERIAEGVGRKPTSYRAGRYGYDRSTAAVLTELNYRVDSSVLPMFEYLGEGGPDFRMAAREPYRNREDGDVRGGELVELPVTVGFTRANYDWQRSVWIGLRKSPWKRLRIAGIADCVGIARRVKLSPEGTRLRDLRKVIDSAVRDGLSTLVLMLHSTSLAAGFSPYAKTERQLEELYDRLSGTILHATETHGFQGATLTDAAKSFEGAMPTTA